MMAVLHEDRARAGSFGADPARYDRARPSYPAAMVDDLLAGGAGRVLDVGCGTGIAARLFTARGCQVLGVEPDERMAAFARRRGVEVEDGRFEEWAPAGRSFDLVVSGQAWHWVDPVVGAERAAVVLERGGGVGLFWNCGRHEPLVQRAFDDVYRRLATDVDRYSVVLGHLGEDRFEFAAAGLRRSGAFDAVERRTYSWATTYTREEWLDQLPTHSDHQQLPPATLDALLAEVGAAIDGFGGSFPMRYETVVVTAVRG